MFSEEQHAMAGVNGGEHRGMLHTIPNTPSTAMARNQISITGPNALPMRAVPRP
jgi:hypothetical protein